MPPGAAVKDRRVYYPNSKLTHYLQEQRIEFATHYPFML
jgi:hypothetical protein